jgi:hypothetical protein
METQGDDVTQKMKTLSECLNEAVDNGYTENFRLENGRLMTEDSKVSYGHAEVAIPNFYRYEGYSDPQDNSILYLIETTDGTRGTLVDSYGVDSDASVSNFVQKIRDINKKPT